MIAPLEFIFGGGDGDDGNDEPEKENQSGGAAAAVFTKKCSEIKNKYGVPIGYSCIITQKINYNTAAPDEIQEISDDDFDRLFERSTENRAAAHAAPPSRKTRRRHRVEKSKRAAAATKKSARAARTKN